MNVRCVKISYLCKKERKGSERSDVNEGLVRFEHNLFLLISQLNQFSQYSFRMVFTAFLSFEYLKSCAMLRCALKSHFAAAIYSIVTSLVGVAKGAMATQKKVSIHPKRCFFFPFWDILNLISFNLFIYIVLN